MRTPKVITYWHWSSFCLYSPRTVVENNSPTYRLIIKCFCATNHIPLIYLFSVLVLESGVLHKDSILITALSIIIVFPNNTKACDVEISYMLLYPEKSHGLNLKLTGPNHLLSECIRDIGFSTRQNDRAKYC